MGRSSRSAGTQRCSAKDCGTCKSKFPKLKFFRFPANIERCKEWVRRSGDNLLLLHTHSQLLNKALCSRHFLPNCFRISGNIESGLNQNVLPTIFTKPFLGSDEMPPNYLITGPSPASSSANSENASPGVSDLKVKKNYFVFSAQKQSASTPSHGKASQPTQVSGGGVTSSFPAVLRTPLQQSSLQNASVPVSADALVFEETPVSTFLGKENVPSCVENVHRKRRRLDYSDINFKMPSQQLNAHASMSPPLPTPVSFHSSQSAEASTTALFDSSTPLAEPLPGADALTPDLSCIHANNATHPTSHTGLKRKSPDTPADTLFPGQSSDISPGNVIATPKKPSQPNLRASVLSNYGVHKTDVTPRKKKMITHVRSLQLKVRSLQRSLMAVKDSKKALIKLANHPSVEKLKFKTKEAGVLFEAQLQNRGKKRNGHRWTLEQKTLGLVLLRNSRKNYSFLCKILKLPGATTLRALMSKIEFEVGQNKHFFEHLKETVKDFKPMDRAVTVMWDEVHVKSALKYMENKDRVVGYVDHDDGEHEKTVANKCLVFMVQSLSRPWKQPVAYYFSHGETPDSVLQKLIVCVIVSLQDIGFDVRASVSDQGGNNVAAVGALRSKLQPNPKRKAVPFCADCTEKRKKFVVARKASGLTKASGSNVSKFSRRNCRQCRLNAIKPSEVTYYRINRDCNIYHFWDVPHLLKNTRNNFQTYNVEYEPGKVAKWLHLEQLHRQDGIDGTFYHMTLKLTDSHLQARKNGQKMKVSLAAQILSCKVATALKKIHDWSDGEAIPGGINTSEFIFFIDQLFDSFNGGSAHPTGKALRTNLSENSAHWDFWEKAEKKIKQWFFLGSERVFPFQVGWLENITSVRGLWSDLRRDFQWEYLNLRKLNQDPLENLFSVIKQNGHKVPTVTQFVAGLKTAIVTNLRNSGVRGANCEDDNGSLLTNLNDFLRAASGGKGNASSSVAGDSTASEEGEEQPSVDETPVIPEESLAEMEKELNQLGFEIKREPPSASSTATCQKQLVTGKDSRCDQGRDIFEVLLGDDNASPFDECAVQNCSCRGPGELVDDEVLVIGGLSQGSQSTFITMSDFDQRPEKKQRKQRASKNNPLPPSDEQLIQDAIAQENTALCGNRRQMTAYISGYMVKKVVARVKCDDCKATLLTDWPTMDHDLVLAFERDDIQLRLTYAQSYVIDITVACVDIFLRMMHTHFHKPHLRLSIEQEINTLVDLSPIGCEEQALEVRRLLILYFCRVSIHHRCRILNRLLAKTYTNDHNVTEMPAARKSVSSSRARTTPALAATQHSALQATSHETFQVPESRVMEEAVDDPRSMILL